MVDELNIRFQIEDTAKKPASMFFCSSFLIQAKAPLSHCPLISLFLLLEEIFHKTMFYFFVSRLIGDTNALNAWIIDRELFMSLTH